MLSRRSLVTGPAFGALAYALTGATNAQKPAEVRRFFGLEPDTIHLAGLLLASHPAPVRAAIEKYRDQLDRNPPHAFHEMMTEGEDRVRDAAGKYMDVRPADVALTDSTTMGIALMYGGVALKPGDEVLTTEHDHYSTNKSLDLLVARTGATIKRIKLYDDPATATADGMTAAIKAALTPATRLVAVTWVHSGTGVKTPLKRVSEVIAARNAALPPEQRALLFADGVHGFGVEDETIPSLGVDAFVAATHKWIFGPRGTGVFWANDAAQARLAPLFPSFSVFVGDATWGRRFTPGGFHTFEHRWAAAEAFQLHLELGKAKVASRLHELATYAKDGLGKMKHVKLRTPRDPAVSAGIVCFDVDGMKPDAVVAKLAAERIVASTTPYAVSYARFTPALWNDERELDKALGVVAGLGRRS